MSGFLTAPIMYITNRAAKGLDYLENRLENRAVTSAPVANPRANPAHVTGQPVTLPGEVTAPKSNTSAGKAQGQSSGTAQSKPSYDTNTLWGWMKSTGYGDASFSGRRDL